MKEWTEIYEQMRGTFAQRAGFVPSEGCDSAVRLYALAAELQSLLMQADWVLDQSFPQTAQGMYLDYHAETRGITRAAAEKAVGTLRFAAADKVTAACPIEKGTVCMTAEGVRFETTEDATIAVGSQWADVPAQAVEAGAGGNVIAGTVTLLSAMPVGVVQCTNPAAFSGGCDAESDEALRGRVLAHEVAVVSGQGVSIDLAIDRGSIDRRGSVAALDIVRIQLHFLQSASLDQLVQLVIGKSINISSGGGVGQDGILGRGLGLSSQIDGDLAAVVAVLLDELVADFTQQILILFSAPHGQGNILSEGSGSSLVENVALSSSALCGALGSGGSSLSGRGCCAAGRAATAGCQRQGHDTGHGKAQLLFHNCVLLLLLVFARCSNNSQCCAIMLRICFTILRIQDFCAGVNVHN